MSQPVSDRPILLDSAEQPTASSTAASEALRFDLTREITSSEMEENANSLMDQLFVNLDRMLERGVPMPVEPEPVEEPKPPLVLPLEAILPPQVTPRDLIPKSIELPETEPQVQSTPEEQLQDSIEVPEKKQGWSPLWLVVLGSSMLLSAGMLGFLFRDQLTHAWLSFSGQSASESNSATTGAAPSDPKAQQDNDFLHYLGRSLDRLARKAEIEPSPAILPSPVVSPSPSVVERVYVPVYPSAQLPTVPSPVAGSSSSPAVTPNASNRGTAKPVTPTVTASPVPSATPAVPNIAAVTTHTLIGVLELGDRSAALFEVNGTPQRVEIGEQIGTSGWSLVSISNQEAIVRRNGEVRSIYVGQKF